MLIIDVETIAPGDPAQRAYLAENAPVPSNIKDAAKIAARRAEFIDKAALHPLWSEPVAICWAWAEPGANDPARGVLRDPAEPVAAFLARFRDQVQAEFSAGDLRGVILGGWNVLFDLRTLSLASIRAGVALPFRLPFELKRWDKAICDVQALVDPEERLKLRDAAYSILGRAPDTAPGSEVGAMWADAARRAQIIAHCLEDVELTRDIYLRILDARAGVLEARP